MIRRPPSSTLFPSPTLFRSERCREAEPMGGGPEPAITGAAEAALRRMLSGNTVTCRMNHLGGPPAARIKEGARDRKSTRLNSSHANISYAVFCLKKKKKK